MFTACKKDNEMPKKENGFIYNSTGIVIENPNFKLIDNNYYDNGCFGKLYYDENHPTITYFEVIKSSKTLLYKGKYDSHWVGDKFVTSCSSCNNYEKDCRVDAVTNENGYIVAIRITRLTN